MVVSDCLHLFGVRELVRDMRREYNDQSDYPTFLRVHREALSPLHAILEYNHRYEFGTVDNHTYTLQSYCEHYGLPEEDQDDSAIVAMLHRHHRGLRTDGQCSRNRTVLLSGESGHTHILTFDVVANTKHLSHTYEGNPLPCSPIKRNSVLLESTTSQFVLNQITNQPRQRKAATQQEGPPNPEPRQDDYLPYLGLIFP